MRAPSAASRAATNSFRTAVAEISARLSSPVAIKAAARRRATERGLLLDRGRRYIFGFLMDGHGALALALGHSRLFNLVSIFAPISAPMTCNGDSSPHRLLRGLLSGMGPADACANGRRANAALLLRNDGRDTLNASGTAGACTGERTIVLKMGPLSDAAVQQ